MFTVSAFHYIDLQIVNNVVIVAWAIGTQSRKLHDHPLYPERLLLQLSMMLLHS